MNAPLSVARPAHVPDAAVYDFDLHTDAELLRNPHDRVRDLLREAPPVFWTPRNGGHWMAMGHDEVYALSRDTENFTNVLMPPALGEQLAQALPPEIPYLMRGVPIGMDPPAHTKYRAPLQAAFSPRAMMARREEIRALADVLIDDVIASGHCDFIAAIGEPLPVKVFLKLLGLPLERLAEFRELVHMFLAPGLELPFEMARRQRRIANAIGDVIRARQVEPRDDLISLLWRSEIDGSPPTFKEMEEYCVLLFIAGLDTVINGMGYGIRHLAQNPDLQERLRAEPGLIVETAEEILRRYTFTVPPRRVAKDVEFAGWQMKENDRLMIFLPGADLDPRTFESPETFDLKRENNVHIAFGVGPHRCLGSHLARIELQVLYEQMLRHLPPFRLDERASPRFRGGNILAIESLPIRWD